MKKRESVRLPNPVIGALMLPFFLLFVGDAQIPVGDSKATVPIAILLLSVVFIIRMLWGAISLSRATVLLAMILMAGVVGTLLTPQAQIARAIAGALPLAYALMAYLVYDGSRLCSEQIAKCMTIGGLVLAVWVIILGAPNLGAEGEYYEEKLRVETLLGRSNYLAAFLLFLVGLSWTRSRLIAIFFAIAIFCTMSRGGVLMLMVLFFAFFLARRGKLWLVGVFSLASIAGLLAFLARSDVEAVGFFVDISDSRLDSTINRLRIWAYGLDLWTSSPLVGIGPNTFRTFVESSGDVEDVWGVHNSILLMLLNYGLVGTILYTVYLRTIYRELVRAELADRRMVSVRAAFITLLVFGLFEPLVGSGAFELLLALLFVFARSVGNDAKFPQSRPRPQKILAVA